MKKTTLILITFILTFVLGVGATFAFFKKIKPYLEQKKIEKQINAEIEQIKLIPEEKFSVKNKPKIFLGDSALQILNDSIPKIPRKELFLKNLPEIEDLPEEKLLAVPFICQNPLQNVAGWKWHDASCEEASVLQNVLFLENKKMTKQEAHEYILEMLEWEKKPENFGEHRDIYKEDLEKFAEGFFNLDKNEVFFFEDADENFIKQVIAFGLPVVVPTIAKDLHNPFYHHPGYHMLTAIGYNENKVITNDVGTRRGEKFPYTWDKLMMANKAAKGGVLVIWPMSEDEIIDSRRQIEDGEIDIKSF